MSRPSVAVLAAMQTPRTMPELCSALPALPAGQVRATVYNAVTRGHATNLRASEGRKCGGLFVATHDPAPMRPEFAGLVGAWR